MNISNIQRQEIKKWQNEYITSKAEHDTIKTISKENELKILQDHVFTDDEGERVLKYSYDIEDQQFKQFLTLLFEENKKSGLPVYDAERVPEEDARKKMVIAEKELFRLQLETLPSFMVKDIKEIQENWKLKEDALNLILKLDV